MNKSELYVIGLAQSANAHWKVYICTDRRNIYTVVDASYNQVYRGYYSETVAFLKGYLYRCYEQTGIMFNK